MARERRRPMRLTEAIGRAVTRRARPAAPEGDSARQARALTDAVGSREAARQLGVSERTLRRWRTGAAPSRANAARLARRESLNSRREARLRNRGAFVRMAGTIGGGTPGARRSNKRHRVIGAEGNQSVHLDGDQMSAILDAWEAGDDQGAVDALRDALADEYDFGAIQFEDLTMLEFLRDDPNG